MNLSTWRWRRITIFFRNDLLTTIYAKLHTSIFSLPISQGHIWPECFSVEKKETVWRLGRLSLRSLRCHKTNVNCSILPTIFLKIWPLFPHFPLDFMIANLWLHTNETIDRNSIYYNISICCMAQFILFCMTYDTILK